MPSLLEGCGPFLPLTTGCIVRQACLLRHLFSRFLTSVADSAAHLSPSVMVLQWLSCGHVGASRQTGMEYDCDLLSVLGKSTPSSSRGVGIGWLKTWDSLAQLRAQGLDALF